MVNLSKKSEQATIIDEPDDEQFSLLITMRFLIPILGQYSFLSSDLSGRILQVDGRWIDVG
jgi:hypothetical protein